MSATIQEFGIDRLPVAERLSLIEKIWDSVPDAIETADVPDWHLAELAERRTDMTARPSEGRPWREVMDDIEAGG